MTLHHLSSHFLCRGQSIGPSWRAETGSEVFRAYQRDKNGYLMSRFMGFVMRWVLVELGPLAANFAVRSQGDERAHDGLPGQELS